MVINLKTAKDLDLGVNGLPNTSRMFATGSAEAVRLARTLLAAGSPQCRRRPLLQCPRNDSGVPSF